METKKWYRSKTVWAGVVGAIVVAYNSASASFGLPVIPEFVYGLLSLLGVYGRVTASTSVE